MKRGKRILLGALALGALLAADAWISHRLTLAHLTQAGPAEAVAVAAEDPIAAFRRTRQQLRARQEAQLNDIIHAQAGDERLAAQAQERLLAMLEHARAESEIEGILQSRGFEDALVSVSDAAANVLVRREALTSRETAVILDLVMRQTGLTGGNVKIIPVK